VYAHVYIAGTAAGDLPEDAACAPQNSKDAQLFEGVRVSDTSSRPGIVPRLQYEQQQSIARAVEQVGMGRRRALSTPSSAVDAHAAYFTRAAPLDA
jgi:hypothetical protein